jgi:hypothetical protein
MRIYVYYIAYFIYMNTAEFAVEFIPIVLVYIFLAYTRDAILFSNTILGKCIAISIIVFYTQVSSVYGLFVCMLLLVYYQTDFVEEILNMEHADMIENRLYELNRDILQNWNGKRNTWSGVNDETTIANNVASARSIRDILSDTKDSLLEGFRENDPDRYSYNTYKNAPYIGRTPDVPDKKTELMNAFRAANCVNGVLQHKGADVPNEMAEHIFSELHFTHDWARCNPCDTNCRFSIIEERMNVEDKMKTPVSSNDFFENNISYMKTAFGIVTNELSAYFGGSSISDRSMRV